jgi:hypothetical protein
MDDKQRMELARSAAGKKARGQKLSREESRALDWAGRRQREQMADETLRALPKGLYCRLAGRQQKVVDEQASRYGLPLLGATVDLYSVVKAYHDFLAANAARLSDNTDVDLQRVKLQAEIEVLERRVKLLDADIADRKGRLISRAELVDRLEAFSGRLRGLGDRLLRQFGNDALAMLNEFLSGEASAAEAQSRNDGDDPDHDRRADGGQLESASDQ